MRVGQARRRDAAEPAIVAALEALGADVTRLSDAGAPDLLVEFRARLYAFEVKSERGKRTKAQHRSRWPIVRTPEEALLAIGAQTVRMDPGPLGPRSK